jgi:hypothetical protein
MSPGGIEVIGFGCVAKTAAARGFEVAYQVAAGGESAVVIAGKYPWVHRFLRSIQGLISTVQS